MENDLLYLFIEQVEEYVEIDKGMKPEDLVYGNHNFKRYRTVISLLSNFLTEVTDTDEIYKVLSELKSDYLAGQDEEIDDVTENASLVYNNELKFFDDYIINNKQKTPTKRISSEKLLKPGSTSIRFLSQETIAERVKLKPRERKKTGTGLKILTPNKLLIKLPIL